MTHTHTPRGDVLLGELARRHALIAYAEACERDARDQIDKRTAADLFDEALHARAAAVRLERTT